jgi:hypothetical protein
MITHIVLLKPKADVNKDEIAAALDQVRSLQQAIPGILSVQAGLNLNSFNNLGYTHGFVMQFASAEHLKAYAPHPTHRIVGRELRRISESIIDFDIDHLPPDGQEQ